MELSVANSEISDRAEQGQSPERAESSSLKMSSKDCRPDNTAEAGRATGWQTETAERATGMPSCRVVPAAGTLGDY